MGVYYEWADEHQIIMHIYLEAPWTWKNYNDTMQEALGLIRAKDHTCATIINIAQMGSIPTGGNMLQILLNVERMTPRNLQTSVIVGSPYIVVVFLNMVMHLRPRTKDILLFAQTMQEAHEKIQSRLQNQGA